MKLRNKFRRALIYLLPLIFLCGPIVGAASLSGKLITDYYEWLAKNWNPSQGAVPSWQVQRLVDASPDAKLQPMEVVTLIRNLKVLHADPRFDDVSWFIVAAAISDPALDTFAIDQLERTLAGSLPKMTFQDSGIAAQTPNERFLAFLDRLGQKLQEIRSGPEIGQLTGKLLAKVHLSSGELLPNLAQRYFDKLDSKVGTLATAFSAARGIQSDFEKKTLALKVDTFASSLDAIFSNSNSFFRMPMDSTLLLQQAEIRTKLKLHWEEWSERCQSWQTGLHIAVYGSGDSSLRTKIEDRLRSEIQESYQSLPRLALCELGRQRFRMAMDLGERIFNTEWAQTIRTLLFTNFPTSTPEDLERKVFQQLVWVSSDSQKIAKSACDLTSHLPFHDQIAQEFVDPVSLGMDDNEPAKQFVDCYAAKRWGANYLGQLGRRRTVGNKRALIQWLKFQGGMRQPTLDLFLPEVRGDPEVQHALQNSLLNNDLPHHRSSLLVMALLTPSLRSDAISVVRNLIFAQPEQITSIINIYFFRWRADEKAARAFFKGLLIDLALNKQELWLIAKQFPFWSDIRSGSMLAVFAQELKQQALEKLNQQELDGLEYLAKFQASDNQNGIAATKSLLENCTREGVVHGSDQLSPLVDLGKNIFLPEVREFVFETLSTLPSSPCSSRGYKGGFLYLALSSGDARLENLATSILANRTQSARTTAAIELRHVVEELSEFLSANTQLKEQLATLAPQISRVPVEYDLLAPELEGAAVSSSTSPYSLMARNWIRIAKGEEYLRKILSSASLKHREFIYINGGYSTASNNQANEADLMTFHLGLFNESTRILNAGGPHGTIVAPGNGFGELTVDPDQPQPPKTVMRKLRLLPGLDLGQPFDSATRQNIEKAFRAIPPSTTELTVVYGGHGDTSGFASWGGDRLSARDILNFEKLAPKTTVVRSIFMQCFAGSTVVLPKRVIPKLESSLRDFVDHHYPSNRCGLAVSSEDEVNRYLSHLATWQNGAWSNSPWARMFASRPIVSLQSTKEFLFTIQGRNSVATPMLTTDYYVRDLAETLCIERDMRAGFVRKFGENPARWSPEAKLTWSRLSVADRDQNWQNVLDNVCSSPLLAEIKKIRQDQAEFYQSLLGPAERFSRQVAGSIIAQYYPDTFAENKAIWDRLEQMGQAEFRKINQRAILIENKAIFDEIRVMGNLTDEFNILVASLLLDPRFTDDFNQYAFGYIRKYRDRFKDYLPEILKVVGPPEYLKMPPVLDQTVPSSNNNSIPVFNNLLLELRDNLFGRYTELQAQRKVKELVVQKFLRDQVEFLMRDPSLQFYAQRYEEIRRCETSGIGN